MEKFKRNGNRKAKAGSVPDEIGMEAAQKQVFHSQHLKFIGISLKQDRGYPMKEDTGLFFMAINRHGYMRLMAHGSHLQTNSLPCLMV